MITKAIKKFSESIEKLKRGAVRFPETTSVVFVLAMLSLLINHNVFDFKEVENFILVLLLAIPFSTFGSLIIERMNGELKKRMIIDGVVAIGLVVFFFFIPEEKTGLFMIRFGIILLSGLFTFTMIPYFYKRDNYSIYMLKLISNFAISVLFFFIINLGLSAILFTIEKLFELSISSEFYVDIFIILWEFLAVVYFVGLFPKYTDKYTVEDYPELLKVLFGYIITPLLIAYTVILYLYFVRVILLKQFPINLLSHLVLWYGVISVIVLFYIRKIKDQYRLTQLFYRYFPVAIMVPLGMLFLAIGKRIYDYDITPPRYYVVLVGLWVLGSMLYILRSKKMRSTFLVVAALVILLLSVYGPQNAFNVSLINQEARFETVLKEYELLENQKIIATPELSKGRKHVVSDFLLYFNRNDQLEEVDILPEGFELSDSKEVFGFEIEYYYGSINAPKNRYNYHFNMSNKLIDATETDYFVDLNLRIDENHVIEDQGLEINYDEVDRTLRISHEQEVLGEINMEEMLDSFHQTMDGKNIATLEEATLTHEFEKARVKLILENIYVSLEDEEIAHGNIRARLFIKLK